MRKSVEIVITLCLFACVSLSSASGEGTRELIRGSAGSTLLAEDFGTFNEPWAMTFLPSGELLITEKPGTIYLYEINSQSRRLLSGLPPVSYGGQGGLGDIILHPEFEENQFLYISYAEQDASGKRGAAVARARLHISNTQVSVEDWEIIWRQFPSYDGSGHYSHRLVFDSEGYLYITSGDRQQLHPAQDWAQNLGKIIRLNADGSVPPDNPFQDKGELAKTFWTTGHRNALGIAFDERGQLWAHEMGPLHGDELNRILAGENYGWPEVSWGNHYSGAEIPDHDTRPEFREPEEYWIPSIAPSGLIIYNGSLFSSWNGNAIIGGLVSRALVRVELSESGASEVERFDMNRRIREVEQGPDGALWVLEDRENARLRRLTPGSTQNGE